MLVPMHMPWWRSPDVVTDFVTKTIGENKNCHCLMCVSNDQACFTGLSYQLGVKLCVPSSGVKFCQKIIPQPLNIPAYLYRDVSQYISDHQI